MLLLWLSASILFIFLYEVNSMTIVPYIREWFGTSTGIPATHNYYWDFFTLFSQINMEGCVAASIKLGKLWYVKQQEIDILKHEKEKTLPADRDDLIQPAFLVDLLKRIESLASRDPQLASACINKIRNLIVYILYETAAPQVLVEKEIDILKQYIDLEKLTSGKILQVDTSIEGVEGSETIVPFIILPLVENAFKQVALYPIQNPWVHLQIRVQQSNLNIYLSWSKPVDTSSLINGRNVILRNLSKRLRLIYPQSHKLSMSIKADNVTVALNMDLKKAIK
jgi:LytS/YehU family sensor histidine kinase